MISLLKNPASECCTFYSNLSEAQYEKYNTVQGAEVMQKSSIWQSLKRPQIDAL